MIASTRPVPWSQLRNWRFVFRRREESSRSAASHEIAAPDANALANCIAPFRHSSVSTGGIRCRGVSTAGLLIQFQVTELIGKRLAKLDDVTTEARDHVRPVLGIEAQSELRRASGSLWASLTALTDAPLSALAGKRTDLPHPSTRRHCRRGR